MIKKKRDTVLLLAAITCSMLTACGGSKEEQKKAPAVVKTEIANEQIGLGNKTYVGVVEEESSTAVNYNGSGMLTHVYVSQGQHVSRGQLIATVDATQARNMLHAAEAQMKQANDAYERMKILYDNNALPEIKWVETLSKVDQAKAQLDLAKKNLADCTIHAPASGVIGSEVKSAGETVLPAMTIATILNISNVKIKASIPEKEVAAIQPSTPTRITVDAIQATFEGGRIEKGVEADVVTHTYDIRILVPNKGQQLLPGMVCNVEVKGSGLSTHDSSCVTVPITAVQQGAHGENYVWVMAGGKAHRQQVQLGNSRGDRIAISSGLNTGDIIITEGFHRLSEGTEVTPAH
ncbi:MAG: efflux RND transporter periplasmic adaptor subunit [Bacteroidaceae bacterium]|nr:efflux RND transporter periplasmic adaptor subunit [Bacteroidaceae bacterium]